MRQRAARLHIDSLATWLDAQPNLIPKKSERAGAIRYARSRWEALTRYLDDARLEISNNAAGNAIRAQELAVRRLRRRRRACRDFYTLIRTAKLNGLEPETYLRDVLTRIGAHPINRLHELLPWNIAAPATQSVAA